MNWYWALCSKTKKENGLAMAANIHPMRQLLWRNILNLSMLKHKSILVILVAMFVPQEKPWKCIFLEINTIDCLQVPEIFFIAFVIFLEYLDASIRNKMVRTADGFYTCTDCDYSTRYLTTCQNHIESKHVSTAGIQCQFCTTVCPTRHALTMHMGRRHKKNIWFNIWLM